MLGSELYRVWTVVFFLGIYFAEKRRLRRENSDEWDVFLLEVQRREKAGRPFAASISDAELREKLDSKDLVSVGSVPSRQRVTSWELGRIAELRRTLCSLEQSGLSTARAAAALHREIRRHQLLAARFSQLWRLWFFRAIAGVGGASLARSLMLLSPLEGDLLLGDRAAQTLGFLVLGVASWLLSKQIPRSWLGTTQLSKEALQWLRDYAQAEGGSSPSACLNAVSWSAAVDYYRVQEIASGMSCRDEVRRLLDEMAQKHREKELRRLQRLEDILPLFELFSIGVPVVLVILVPILEIF